VEEVLQRIVPVVEDVVVGLELFLQLTRNTPTKHNNKHNDFFKTFLRAKPGFSLLNLYKERGENISSSHPIFGP
jgi:hypothetical protein